MSGNPTMKLNIGKGILILLILLYVGLSFTDCTYTLHEVWDETLNSYRYEPGRGSNNFSWLLIICAGAQILLIFCNRYYLQMISGIIAALPGFVTPLRIQLNNLLAEMIVYIKEGPRYYKMQVTAMGWIVFILAGTLLVASIIANLWFKKQKALLSVQ